MSREAQSRRLTILVASLAGLAGLAAAGAVIGGICNLGADLVDLAGVGFATFAGYLQPFRTLFLIGTVSLVALAWAMVLLPRLFRDSLRLVRVHVVGYGVLLLGAAFAIVATWAPPLLIEMLR